MEYLTSTKSYPVTSDEKQIVPLLRDPFCRAVVFRSSELTFDPSGIAVSPDPSLALRYWRDETAPRGRLASGRMVHTTEISEEQILQEAREANIEFLGSHALKNFTEICNKFRATFSNVFAEYSGVTNAGMRGFTLFTPIGGRGRSPELHADNTILTLHWAAAKASFPVSDCDLSENIWRMLDRNHQNSLSLEDRAANHARLIDMAADLPLVENKIGDVMITKGQLNRDLTNPDHRQGVCVHASSPSIIAKGQAGFLMTPKMPEILPL